MSSEVERMMVGSFKGVEIHSNPLLKDDQIAITSGGRVIALGPLNALKSVPPGAGVVMSEEMFRLLNEKTQPLTLSQVEASRLKAATIALRAPGSHGLEL